ncbi:MAG: pyrimidine dimer DNA glycosylase/endonuclease V [Candidatus Pacearchaeota archaeon]
MNIFYLDSNATVAPKYLCDKHVVKMVVESAQILSTVVQLKKLQPMPAECYAVTHAHHPCVLWAGKSIDNFQWLTTYALNLALEYTFRYNKAHKSSTLLMHIAWLLETSWLYSATWPEVGFTEPPQCMPDKYKGPDTVEAYRAYYKGEKARFAKWAHSEEPEWWK